MHAICDVSLINNAKWSDFVFRHPHGNIFQTPEMYFALTETDLWKPFILCAIDDAGSIEGVLSAVIQKEYKGFGGFVSSRSITWGGPIVRNDDPINASHILEEYEKKISSRCIYSQFRNIFDISFFRSSYIAKGYQYQDHLDIHIDLTRSETTLWDGLHSSRRNDIRKAKKEGVIVELRSDADSLKESHTILIEVYKRAHLPLPGFDLFSSMIRQNGERFNLLNFVAVYQKKIIGCMLVLAYKNTLYDFYAGSLTEFYKKFPNDLIPWEIFLWGKENGYDLFDFGGAGKPGIPYGVRDYKSKFGGEIVNFGRYEKIHFPFLYRFAKTGFKIWQKIR